MVEGFNQSTIEWENEPHYKEHAEGLETVESWLGSIENWSSDSELIEIYEQVVDNPSTYNFSFLHGTQSDSLQQIVSDNALRPSIETENSNGEIGNCDHVSSTGSPFIANLYASRAQPDLEQVYNAIEEDIVARTLTEEERNIETAESIIRDALNNSKWCYAGIALEDADLSRQEEKSYIKNREMLYSGIVDRLNGLEDSEPVIISFQQQNLVTPTQRRPLFRNEVGRENLSEVKSKAVNIDDQIKAYVPKVSLEKFETMYTGIEFGSLEGLEIIHAARNKSQYIENSSKMEYTTVWEGKDRGTHSEQVDYQFDILNPDLF